MNYLNRQLILLTILLSGTQVIILPVGSLTIFQIVLIIAGIVSIMNLFQQGYLKTGKYLIFAVIFAVSSVVAFITSTYASWARSYLLLGFMAAFLILILPMQFGRNDIQLLEKTLIRSQYIVFPFSIYSFYMFYFKGGIPNRISLFAGLHINLDTDTLIRAQAANQIRLTLPYATPPVLSIVMAMCIVMLFVDKKLFKPIIRWGLIVAYATVLVLTGSRTGIIALIILAVSLVIKRLPKKKTIGSKQFAGIIAVAFVSVMLFVYCVNNTYMTKFINRFASVSLNSLKTDRHFLVPLDGVLIWLSSFKNFFVGIGFGSSMNMQGMHTYLPPYFLNSFITLVAERGILGLLLVIMLLNLAIRMARRYDTMESAEKAITFAYITGLISCVFYEGLTSYFLIFVIAIAYVVDLRYELSHRVAERRLYK